MRVRVGIFSALVLLTCVSCFSSTPPPSTRYFWIPLWDNVPVASGPRLPVVIQVEAPDVDAAFDHLRIVYRVSPVQLRHYKLRVWVTKPGRLLRIGLRRYLQATRSFKIITDAPRPLPNYVLRGQVVALEQVEEGHQGARWYARVALVLRLHRALDDKVVWRLRMDRRREVKKRTPQRIIKMMTTLIRAELDRALPSMIAVIKQELDAK